MSKCKATDNLYERKYKCLINMWKDTHLPSNEKYQNRYWYTSFCLSYKDSQWCDCLDIIGGSVSPCNSFRSSLAVCIKRT